MFIRRMKPLYFYLFFNMSLKLLILEKGWCHQPGIIPAQISSLGPKEVRSSCLSAARISADILIEDAPICWLPAAEVTLLWDTIARGHHLTRSN